MPTRSSKTKKKKPADLNQIAASIVEEVTAEPAQKKQKSITSTKSKKH